VNREVVFSDKTDQSRLNTMWYPKMSDRAGSKKRIAGLENGFSIWRSLCRQCCCVAPIMAVVALLVGLNPGSPVLFRQQHQRWVSCVIGVLSP
jgi:lipopolysaccharide/colanic/teichoic acid biosynthesis glycosyltransferase